MSSNPYIAQITLFAGNFEPVGWKFCHGQLLSTSQYEALFSILGTIYGGDGRTTFGLPDLRGRVPLHVGGASGEGPGLSNYELGQKLGVEKVTITANTMPSHSHGLKANNAAADSTDPSGRVFAVAGSTGEALYSSDTSSLVALNASSIADDAVSGLSHNNVQPFQCINFIIAYLGIYPTRN